MNAIQASNATIFIAQVTHEANRVWCQVNGDNSQNPWNESPKWQQDSAISGVQFHKANPDATDSASHENWMKQKIEEGWVYGEVKNIEKKTHPCIMPFDQLPMVQQKKDQLFRAICHALLPVPESCEN